MKSKTIWIATTNEGKIKNFTEIMKDYKIKSIMDFDINLDILETGNTLEENALIKAKTFAKLTNEIAISDDSGLFIDTLDGFPGVYSARWAGEGFSELELSIKILEKIEENKLNLKENKAAMKTCIAYYDPIKNIEKFFYGQIDGVISKEVRGTDGFGYDPIFEPVGGEGKTFAELGHEFKITHSHRSLAVAQLMKFLEGEDNE